MIFWIIHAAVFGVFVSEAAGNPHLSLSSEQSDGLNPQDVVFEFLNQCSGANLDMDSCLVSSTFGALVAMEGPTSNSNDYPEKRRFLQDDCSPPDLNEQDLRLLIGASTAQCTYTDEMLENTVSGFQTLVNSESCSKQLCGDEIPKLLFETMFDKAAECAQVKLDMPQCLLDQVIEMMIMGEDADVGNSETDGLKRRLSHTLSNNMDGQDSTACEQINEFEMGLGISIMLAGADASCSELGVTLSPMELDIAISDLTTLFMAQHCWGNEGCDENHDVGDHQDDHHNDMQDNHHNEMNFMNMAINYVAECAELDLKTDTCLVSNAIAMFTGSDAMPSEMSSKPSRHRFLQDECAPPQFDELTMAYMVEGSKQQCFSNGSIISDAEFDETVVDLMDLFGAQDCWVALCQEGENPSDLFLKLTFDELGKCAGADTNFNPCLRDQFFALINSQNDPDGAFDGVRRKLESFSSLDEVSDPCGEQPDATEISFIVTLLLAGAQEQCMESGETFEVGEVAKAETELFKLFSAQQCWGVPDNCNDHDDHYDHYDDHYNERSGYLEFVEESTTWMLGQCAGVSDISCVFARSIEVMHGIKHLDWSHDGSTGPYHLTEEFALSMCSLPSHEYDIEQIAHHAGEYCGEAPGKTVNDLKNLVKKSECWEDLCEPEIKNFVVEEWMHDCASVDLKFMTNLGQGMPSSSDDASLDNDRLKCMAVYIASKDGPQENWACSIPKLGYGTCGADIGKEAYIQCGGKAHTRSPTHPPSPSPSPEMQFSMSFAYTEMSFAYKDNGDNDAYDWAAYEPEMSFSYSFDGFSMPNDDWHIKDDSEMLVYVEEVCHLIDILNSDNSMICLEPVCAGIWIEDVLMPDDYDTLMPTMEHTSMPTMVPTQPSLEPTLMTTMVPTTLSMDPTLMTTVVPTMYSLSPTPTSTITPTAKKQTRSPTVSPTVIELGSVEVSVEVEIKLEGLVMTDIDFTDLTSVDKVVNFLEGVLEELLSDLSEGARIRILSVGGFSVTRRLLRFLQDPGGVDVEFEIIMTKTCSTSTCDASEADAISESLYQGVSTDLKEKVESGDLTKAIQVQAEAAGVPQLMNASVSATSMQVSKPTVIVKKGKVVDESPDPEDDDDSASFRLGVALSLFVALGSVLLI